MAGDQLATKEGYLIIHPINLADLVLNWKNLTSYIDPVGGGARFANLPMPDLIFLTKSHGDYFSADTLKAGATQKTLLVAFPAVAE